MPAPSRGNGSQSANMTEMLSSVTDLTETLVQKSLSEAARSTQRALAEQRVYYEGLFQRLQEVHEAQLSSAKISSASPSASSRGKRRKKSRSRKIYDRYAGSRERRYLMVCILYFYTSDFRLMLRTPVELHS
jgi:hypothetical protein